MIPIFEAESSRDLGDGLMEFRGKVPDWLWVSGLGEQRFVGEMMRVNGKAYAIRAVAREGYFGEVAVFTAWPVSLL